MRGAIVKIFLLTACSLCAAGTHAQTVIRATDTAVKAKKPAYVVKPKGPKPISREMSGGLSINSGGGFLFGAGNVFFRLGRVKPKDLKHADMFYNTRFWQIDLSEKKNPKEYKLTSMSGTSNSYIYGKVNNLYALKLGRGYMRMLAGKPEPGCVSIHWLYAGGVSLGMLKPYYLKVSTDPSAIKYGEGTESDFLNQGLIEGSAGFGKGLSEMKFVPGFHLKSALHFDFAANKKSVIGMEVGVNAEYYTQEILLLANQPPNNYFIDVYLAFQFGRRW